MTNSTTTGPNRSSSSIRYDTRVAATDAARAQVARTFFDLLDPSADETLAKALVRVDWSDRWRVQSPEVMWDRVQPEYFRGNLVDGAGRSLRLLSVLEVSSEEEITALGEATLRADPAAGVWQGHIGAVATEHQQRLIGVLAERGRTLIGEVFADLPGADAAVDATRWAISALVCRDQLDAAMYRALIGPAETSLSLRDRPDLREPGPSTKTDPKVRVTGGTGRTYWGPLSGAFAHLEPGAHEATTTEAFVPVTLVIDEAGAHLRAARTAHGLPPVARELAGLRLAGLPTDRSTLIGDVVTAVTRLADESAHYPSDLARVLAAVAANTGYVDSVETTGPGTAIEALVEFACPDPAQFPSHRTRALRLEVDVDALLEEAGVTGARRHAHLATLEAIDAVDRTPRLADRDRETRKGALTQNYERITRAHGLARATYLANLAAAARSAAEARGITARVDVVDASGWEREPSDALALEVLEDAIALAALPLTGEPVNLETGPPLPESYYLKRYPIEPPDQVTALPTPTTQPAAPAAGI